VFFFLFFFLYAQLANRRCAKQSAGRSGGGINKTLSYLKALCLLKALANGTREEKTAGGIYIRNTFEAGQHPRSRSLCSGECECWVSITLKLIEDDKTISRTQAGRRRIIQAPGASMRYWCPPIQGDTLDRLAGDLTRPEGEMIMPKQNNRTALFNSIRLLQIELNNFGAHR